MNSFLNNNKIYLLIGAVIVLLLLYFLLDYQIKLTLKNEMKKISDKKKQIHKKNKLKQIRMQMKSEQQDGVDSYIDPAENYREEEMDERPKRLERDDMLIRDIRDGTM